MEAAARCMNWNMLQKLDMIMAMGGQGDIIRTFMDIRREDMILSGLAPPGILDLDDII